MPEFDSLFISIIATTLVSVLIEFLFVKLARTDSVKIETKKILNSFTVIFFIILFICITLIAILYNLAHTYNWESDILNIRSKGKTTITDNQDENSFDYLDMDISVTPTHDLTPTDKLNPTTQPTPTLEPTPKPLFINGYVMYNKLDGTYSIYNYDTNNVDITSDAQNVELNDVILSINKNDVMDMSIYIYPIKEKIISDGYYYGVEIIKRYDGLPLKLGITTGTYIFKVKNVDTLEDNYSCKLTIDHSGTYELDFQ